MNELRKLSNDEIVLSFAASCVEGVARKIGVSPAELSKRMQAVGLLEDYVIPNYGVLHSMSREAVIDDVLDCLEQWEKKNI